jgi:hypothetical protein
LVSENEGKGGFLGQGMNRLAMRHETMRIGLDRISLIAYYGYYEPKINYFQVRQITA